MTRNRFLTPLLLLSCALGAVADARADDAPPRPLWKQALDNDWYKVSLNMRMRIELADFDGLDDGQAYTLRTRLGLGSKPLYGFSAFAEVENVFSFDDDAYNDLVSGNAGEAPIADPEETELNRLWIQYANDDLLGLKLKAGRQRIILDDARFIGNVGWRQNEQTFDAARISTHFGVDGLVATYGWIEEAHRIFGNDGSSATKDFDSNSHFVNISYRHSPEVGGTVFAYLFDFDDSPVNSADTYGFRLTGKKKIDEDWSVSYVGSYAYQQDAENNPFDYDAHYGNVELLAGFAPLGAIGVGYEHLGSDNGAARFVTPLATAHKFNGFADVFLNNGGPNGLRDAYVTIAPKLPFGFAGKLVYHHFWADENLGSQGHEVDFVLKRKLTKNLLALTKGAWFDGSSNGPTDRWRWSVELNFNL